MTKNKSKTKGQKVSARELEREVYRLFKSSPKKQLNPKQVVKKLHVDSNKDSVQHALDRLVQQQRIVLLDGYRYKFNRERADETARQQAPVYEGRVDMTRSGAAYIMVEGQDQDVFVSQKNINTALDGDRVRVRVWKPRGRYKPEGEILEVVKRATEHFVGTLNVFNKVAVILVDGDQPFDILVDPTQLGEAQSGEKVVVKITDWNVGKFGNPTGEITAVLGKPGSSDIDMKAILINNGFQINFTKSVLAEAEALPSTISPQEINRRRDFRDVTTFTIDPLDAKDFDDAISLRTLDNGRLEIGVHIADVTHYVRPGSSLDQEALSRSTSVYLVDRVCPMLPEKISNELCSLRPHEDKLSFSAVFELDDTYQVVNRWFGKTIIHSDRRFTYEEAQDVIDQGKGDFAEELRQLNEIAHKLRARRFKQGSIDFAADEVRFRLAEDGTPLEVYIKERIDTNMLIEDFMLLANREVATYIARKEAAHKERIPFVYRVHDEPDLEKVAELARFASNMGFEMKVDNPKSIARSYNSLMKAAETDPGLRLLAPLAIRTMAKAEYTTENIGHYGLGFEHYSHFTSPIRRYADVLAHRLLEANLGRGNIYKANAGTLEADCGHINSQERRAVTAERESIKYKQVEFIEKHVGEVFAGTVSGIAEFGMFVTLNDSHCEGLVTYDHMPESYEIGPGRLTLEGRRSGQKIHMGDTVRVRILATNLAKRQIEMALEEVVNPRVSTSPPTTDDSAPSRSSREQPKPRQSRSRRSPTSGGSASSNGRQRKSSSRSRTDKRR